LIFWIVFEPKIYSFLVKNESLHDGEELFANGVHLLLLEGHELPEFGVLVFLIGRPQPLVGQRRSPLVSTESSVTLQFPPKLEIGLGAKLAQRPLPKPIVGLGLLLVMLEQDGRASQCHTDNQRHFSHLVPMHQGFKHVFQILLLRLVRHRSSSYTMNAQSCLSCTKVNERLTRLRLPLLPFPCETRSSAKPQTKEQHSCFKSFIRSYLFRHNAYIIAQ
jgi:hypothetical protein